MFALVALGITIWWNRPDTEIHEAQPEAGRSRPAHPGQTQDIAAHSASTGKSPSRLDDLLHQSAKDLEQMDLAGVNLLCAEGLPGTETLDVTQCLATLDQWANRVKTETERHRHRFRERPQEFDHSEGYLLRAKLTS
jgi:hypothetical protein